MRLRTNGKAKKLRGVQPNEGVRAHYRAQLDDLVRKMQKSVVYWLTASYRANEPEIAQDASPAVELRKLMRSLNKQWTRNFNEAAPKLAEYFAKDVQNRTDAQLQRILKKGNFTVNFRMTRTMNDVAQATVTANVSEIKSIPSEYFTEVEGLVMRSVQTGRDLSDLTDQLEHRYHLTRNRAKLIASDQNRKATAAMARARTQELGLFTGTWQHSGGGQHPRHTHIGVMNGKVFDSRVGLYDPAVKRNIHPGELIHCRCLFRPHIPGIDG